MIKIPKLEELLDSKPLFYKKFDPNRIVTAYDKIKNFIKHPKRVQLIGTNGKGSTGRALAHLAYSSNLKVGHFTSPHILDFKERFWIDGRFATRKELEEAHKRVYTLLGEKLANELSYFEYQTLLAFVLFENLDLQVIEAGLGGEFDATTVAEYELNIITPIDFDHKDFLGDSIEEIASTKLKAIKKRALVAKQKEPKVYRIVRDLADQKGVELYLYEKLYSSKKLISIKNILKNYPKYLIENIYLATMGLDILGIEYDISNLKSLKIFGRFYKIASNVTIDVGHNPLASRAIFDSLQDRVTLIFNALDDKEAREILQILRPKIDEVEIIKLNNPRAMTLSELERILKDLNIPFRYFTKLKEDKSYLVFGSFFTVEAFLKEIEIKTIEEEKLPD